MEPQAGDRHQRTCVCPRMFFVGVVVTAWDASHLPPRVSFQAGHNIPVTGTSKVFSDPAHGEKRDGGGLDADSVCMH